MIALFVALLCGALCTICGLACGVANWSSNRLASLAGICAGCCPWLILVPNGWTITLAMFGTVPLFLLTVVLLYFRSEKTPWRQIVLCAAGAVFGVAGMLIVAVGLAASAAV